MNNLIKNDPVNITSPKIGISPEQLTTYLVDLDKVRLFEAEVSNLPWYAGLCLLFLGILIDRLVTIQKIDAVCVLLGIITTIFGILMYRSTKRKSDAWNKLEQEKINLYEGLKE